MSLRDFFVDVLEAPLSSWTWAQRAAYSLANDRGFENRLKWHRSHFHALQMVRLDRETSVRLMILGMPDAAKIASQDARERETAAIELGEVLLHAPLPEPLDHYMHMKRR